MAARIARKKPAPKPEPVQVEEQASPPPPPSLWRRLFPALFFMGVLVAMVYAFYDPEHKNTPRTPVKTEKKLSSKSTTPAKSDIFKARYEGFKAEFAKLQKDDADRDDLLAVSQDFYALYADAKGWPNRPAALYRAAEIMEYSAKKADSESDYKIAANIYEKLVAEFPQSILADDALYAAARLWAFSLGKPQIALRHLATLRDKYPQGDKYVVGMELRKKLLPPPAKPKEQKKVQPALKPQVSSSLAEAKKNTSSQEATTKKETDARSSEQKTEQDAEEDGLDFFGLKQGVLLAIESFFEDEPLQDPSATSALKNLPSTSAKLSRAEAEAQAMLMLSVDHESKAPPSTKAKEEKDAAKQEAKPVPSTAEQAKLVEKHVASITPKADGEKNASSDIALKKIPEKTPSMAEGHDALPMGSVPALVYKPVLMPASLFMSQAVHVLADLQQAPPTLIEPNAPKPAEASAPKSDMLAKQEEQKRTKEAPPKDSTSKLALAKVEAQKLVKPPLAVAHDKNTQPLEAPFVAEIKPKLQVQPEPKSVIKPVAKAEVKPVAKAEVKPVAKVEVKPVAKAEVKPVAKAESKKTPSAEVSSKASTPDTKQAKSQSAVSSTASTPTQPVQKTAPEVQEHGLWQALMQRWQALWQEDSSVAQREESPLSKPHPEPEKEQKTSLVAETLPKNVDKKASLAHSDKTKTSEGPPTGKADNKLTTKPVAKAEPKAEVKASPKLAQKQPSLKEASPSQVQDAKASKAQKNTLAPKPAPLVVPKPSPKPAPVLTAEKKVVKEKTVKQAEKASPKVATPLPVKKEAKPLSKPQTKPPVQVAKGSKGQEDKKTPPPTAQPPLQLLGKNDALSQEELDKRVRNAPKGDLAAQLGLASVRTVYVDIGHGGKDRGTAHNGLIESEVVLDMGKRVGALLKSQGFNVIYSRLKNVFLPLSSRSVKANDAGADLFVSIHMNAFHNGTIQGFETYYLDFSRNSEASRVATLENSVSDRSLGDLQNVLAKMLLNVRTGESRQLASAIQKSTIQALRGRGFKTRDGGTRSAPFHVLIGTSMPAVLVELGYCTHKTEASWLKRSDYRDILAQGIVQGIVRYKKSLEKQSSPQFALTPKKASGK